MTEEQYWWLALALFAVVTVVVAALLSWIIAAAKSIDRHAEAIWTVGKQIAGNTVSIWMLEHSNRSLQRIERAADGAARSVASLTETLRSGGGRAS